MGKYKLTWRDLSWNDFKIYLFALFKAFIPKKNLSSLDDLEDFISAFPEGSLTVILPAKEPLDNRLGGDKIAIRILVDPVAKKLIEKTGPLTATSANISGSEPLRDCEMAAKTLSSSENMVSYLSGTCSGGAPSTLIAWYTVCKSPNSDEIEVLREGLVGKREILEWWKKRI